MKSLCVAVIFFVSALAVRAQSHEVKVGATIGGNLMVLEGENQWQSHPGWNAAAISSYSLANRFTTVIQLGGLVEGVTEKSSTFDGNGGQGTQFVSDAAYSWAEAEAMIGYLPVSRPKFELLIGTGITTRRILKANLTTELNHQAGFGGSSGEVDIIDYVYKWTYLLPVTVGTTFDFESSGSLLFMLEYQMGLRKRFKPREPNPAFDYAWADNNEKVSSISLKLAYLLPVSGK